MQKTVYYGDHHSEYRRSIGGPIPRIAILCDSIFKYIDLYPEAATFAHRGIDIIDLIYKQRNHELPDWNQFELIFIQAGTNDIANSK